MTTSLLNLIVAGWVILADGGSWQGLSMLPRSPNYALIPRGEIHPRQSDSHVLVLRGASPKLETLAGRCHGVTVFKAQAKVQTAHYSLNY